MPIPLAARFVPATLLLAAALTSCSRDPAPDPGAARVPAATTRRPALAMAKAEWPGLTIEVIEITRVGGTLLVRFRFENAAAQPFGFGDRFAADPADRDTLADVALLDPSGRRKYFVLRDRANRPECSTGLSPLEPGEKRELFARFPAPAPGTSRITIQIPHVPEMREVPVAAGGQNGPGIV
jgi:hypothetical protein